jgi:hypothetical protein
MRNANMKKIIRNFGMGLSVAFALSVTSLVANGQLTYTGNINPGTLGGTVTTSLPMFNSALGTLTGVQVTLDFQVTPVATLINGTGSAMTFTPSDSVFASLPGDPATPWTISLGSDNWMLAEPTVTTGPIAGTGQLIASFGSLMFVGGTSASADLTDVSGSDFSAYTGAGDLSFGSSGGSIMSGSSGNGFFGGGSADVTGTASVTYDYTPVPEPTTLALAGLGGLSLMFFRRRK